MVGKQEFKIKLLEETMCGAQHTGWSCGTCFFAISETLTNSDWQSLLLYRGQYEKDELDNLPKNIDKSIDKIWELINGEEND
tara:strand:+ start:112 stop:357 length:246 start_codon:yes stop_codon:yes gene_type:complete